MEAPDPTLVGNNFIVRYYTILSRNPDALHHFYSDRSSRTFGNEDEESTPIRGIEEIKKHIESHEFKQTQVLLSTVDCQGSINGGIFISVVGHISQETTRKFTQTFFLEHLDDKYYVLNDIFRYLHTEEQANGRVNDEEEEEEDIEEPEESSEKAISEPTPAPSSASTPAPATQQSAAPASNVQAPVTTPSSASPAPPVSSPAPAAATPAPAQKPQQEVPLPKSEPLSKSDPTAPSHPNVANKPDQRAHHHDKKADSSKASKSEGPKNWVDIVRPHEGSQANQSQQPQQHQQTHQQVQQSQQHAHQPQQAQQQAQHPEKTSHAQHSSANQNVQHSPQTHPKEPKSKAWPVIDKECSIYARALAYNTTSEQLMQAFSPYGKVTNIVLKSSKGFAFIAFDSPQTVQNALEALKTKNIILPGQSTPLVIEQRKPNKHNAPVTLPHSHGHAPSPHTPRGRGRGPHAARGASPRVPRDDKSSSFSSAAPFSSGQASSTQAQPQQQPQSQQTQQPQTQQQQQHQPPQQQQQPQQQHQYAPKRSSSYADRRSSSSENSQQTPPQRHFSRQHSNASNKPSV